MKTEAKHLAFHLFQKNCGNWEARNKDLFQDSAMQKYHLDATQPTKKSQNLSGTVSDRFTSIFCFPQQRYSAKTSTDKYLASLIFIFIVLFRAHCFMVITKVKGIVFTLSLIWTDGYHCSLKATATVPYCTVKYRCYSNCHFVPPFQLCDILYHIVLTVTSIMWYKNHTCAYHTILYHTISYYCPAKASAAFYSLFILKLAPFLYVQATLSWITKQQTNKHNFKTEKQHLDVILGSKTLD